MPLPPNDYIVFGNTNGLKRSANSLSLWPCFRWDESGSDGADPTVHRYILHFFLEDGTVEMRELADIKGGEAQKNMNSTVTKKQRGKRPSAELVLYSSKRYWATLTTSSWSSMHAQLRFH